VDVNALKAAPKFVTAPALLGSLFLRGLNETECAVVTAFLEARHISPKTAVFREGDTGDEIFILLSGELKAFARQSDGVRRLLFTIAPGHFFGEMAVIAREPRSITIIAGESADLMALRGVNFYRIIHEHPRIGVKILKNIGKVQSDWLEQSTRYLGDLARWGEAAHRRAIIDDLTGLYNRRFIEDSVRDRFSHGAVGQRKMSLMMMDIDSVHGINERYGVKAGDIAIIMVSDILKSIMRSTDISARLSGDEFAVLLPDTDGFDTKRIAERIRETVKQQVIPVQEGVGTGEPVNLWIRISIGIAEAPTHADCWERLFDIADEALRAAKKLGRDRVELAG
jgi:diguanylate cyclase (GGDEF)-like protein